MRYKINPDVVAMGLAACSLYLVTQYIYLPKAGIQAIAHHEDQHIENDRVIGYMEFLSSGVVAVSWLSNSLLLSFRGDHFAWTFSAFATV